MTFNFLKTLIIGYLLVCFCANAQTKESDFFVASEKIEVTEEFENYFSTHPIIPQIINVVYRFELTQKIVLANNDQPFIDQQNFYQSIHKRPHSGIDPPKSI